MKGIYIISILFLACVSAGDALYIVTGSLSCKLFASAAFLIMGTVNAFYAQNKRLGNFGFSALMTSGLFFAFLGDAFIGAHAIAGIALFAAGHICFLACYCRLRKLSISDVICAVVIFATVGIFLALSPMVAFPSALIKTSAYIYTLIISAMTAKAIINFIRQPQLLTLLLAAGSILFAFSDLMLSLSASPSTLPWSRTLCLATYYPAVSIFALSPLTLGTPTKTTLP